MTDSNIEWTEQSWNPLAGCSLASPGCTNCYAMKMAKRCEAMGAKKYAGTTMTVKGKAVWTGKINFDENVLLAPLKRKKPTMYFVNSMSDLFHEHVPDYQRDQIFAIMAICQRHTMQVLTKRSEVMRLYLTDPETPYRIDAMMDSIAEENQLFDPLARRSDDYRATAPDLHGDDWPLKNIWLGVSVEDQRRADERIPPLLATPAAVRWLSCEPLLGTVDLNVIEDEEVDGLQLCFDALTGLAHDGEDSITGIFEQPDARINWVVAGGESGPGAREFNPEWARMLMKQCAITGTPFFMKQMGGANKARMPEIPEDLMIRQYPK